MPRMIAAVVAASALLVAACGDDDTATDAPSDAPADLELPDDDGGADPGADLDDGTAAVVNGHEIAVDEIDAQIEALAGDPELGPQLESEDAQAVVGGQILSMAIQTRILVDAADDLDQPVTDEDITEVRAELEEQSGGAQAFADEIEAQGLTEQSVSMQLTGLAALANIESALVEQSDGALDDTDAPAEPGPDGQVPLSPAEQATQELLVEQLATADITVNAVYGTWDPQTGQITPPGGVAGGAPVPEGQAPPPETDEGG